jgi:aminodeoxyfutalosine deaminase
MTLINKTPKIELHVHFEGAVRPATLLEIARRNDVPLPATTVEELQNFLHYRDFSHFIEMFVIVAGALRTAEDFRQIVAAYAGEAAAHGAVYIEGIFSPGRARRLEVGWDEIFSGYCDGVQEAEESHGVLVRLTPDIYRGEPVLEACEVAEWAVRFKDRGVVGLGLGGLEADFPPEIYARPFAIARDNGLGSVPHAGEFAGPASIRGAIRALGADRIRHGIRAIEDAVLVSELADLGIVLDVCPTSNLCTGAVKSLSDHPLPKLTAAGVSCSISTDDPTMFNTDLTNEYEIAATLGIPAECAYEAGLIGALCDDDTRSRLST